ncbi:transcriptional regulator [Lentibacillus populi]|uniref:Transcriptional regulator n=1 Tax=Lentibacillus populi TaxID=1827502 RepID=A0A9W5U0B3_9BACI|nr:helix-turn-helix domain-containing protein [Lentibacillus populi]MBT2218515.1 helix-turn-helix domain-containing protein [Virgibacillus dakarensis]GGB54854.1 transcriptional regulator [Lentibacillus populi]
MKGKADLLLHPVRMRIVQQLLLNKPLTIAQLVEILGDVPQATLYRHINLLLEANLIEVIETKKVKGTEERKFSVKIDNLQIPESEIETTSREDHIRHFSVFHGNLLQLATSYLADTSPEQYKKEGFSYAYTPLHLSDEEFHELTQSIQQAIEKVIHNQLTPARTTRIFASMFIPQKSPKE